ncbi:Protein of unknown function [Pyronema omphalodes CBS 100304]|uniref:Uncharacterized protein n=1 Tax=Pyronema omphalodes (strain CBS 100304) TaxID=1076935 RepID=U4L4Y1_PYROM|nr:Protein of unknown function [Pyronema omphalodes CBS 100304]
MVDRQISASNATFLTTLPASKLPGDLHTDF